MSADHTLESALLAMAGYDEQREPPANGGYNAFDSILGAQLAARVSAGVALSGKQRRAAHRMLRKYAGSMRSFGVEYAALPDPHEETPPTAEVVARMAAAAPGDTRLTVEDGRVVVRSPYQLKDVCRSVPGGRWNPRATPRGAWTYPESPRAALELRDAFAPYPTATDDAFLTLVASAEHQAAARAHKTATDLPPVPGEVMPSWEHQRQAFWFAREQDAAVLWMDMGTGKSKVTVDLLRENQARRALILCPARVVGVWPKQFRLHGPAERWHVVNGTYRTRAGSFEVDTVEARTRAFDGAVHECRCGLAHVVVANYEASAHSPFREWALEQQWDYVVADESHRLRAPTGVWSKWASKLRDRSTRRLALTGTMLGQSELDAFAQYRFLDPTIFGTSYTSFEHRYAVKGGYQGHEVVAMRTKPTLPDGRPNSYYAPAVAQEFDERLFSVAYEVSSDVLDLPPTRDVTRTFALSPAARRAYKSLDEDLFVDLESFDAGETTAPNVLVKMLRLQQLTGGALSDDEGKAVEVHTGKRDLLVEQLSDLDWRAAPVVVFCRFLHDLRQVEAAATKVGAPYAELSGSRSDALTADSTLAPDSGVVGVQIQSGGVGIDFTKSAVAVYYSLGFSRIDFVQSRKRLDRPGQTRPVLFLHLVAEGTIDVDVYEAMERNEEAVQWVAKRLLRERRSPAPAGAADGDDEMSTAFTRGEQ